MNIVVNRPAGVTCADAQVGGAVEITVGCLDQPVRRVAAIPTSELMDHGEGICSTGGDGGDQERGKNHRRANRIHAPFPFGATNPTMGLTERQCD